MMNGLLVCGGCEQNFDLDQRRPKLLPFGNTLCVECILKSRWESSPQRFTEEPAPFAVTDRGNVRLQDDLQLVCWLEAASQGLLECICCRCPFDSLFRRPAALDCGHAVCRVCLQEANETASTYSSYPQLRRLQRQRRDSIDESWDYSQEDTSSSASSLPSDPGLVVVAACPIVGCSEAVRVHDHRHLLDYLNGSTAPKHAKRISCDDGRSHAEVQDTLALLEERVTAVFELLGHNLNGGTNVDARAILGVDELTSAKALAEQNLSGRHTGHSLKSLLEMLNRIVEHMASPRSEQPEVFKQNSPTSDLPDLLLNEKFRQSTKSPEDFSAASSLKECKMELNVWNLSMSIQGEFRVKKEALLKSDTKVLKLTGVDCWCDPEWTLRLLRRWAPDLEQLQLCYPTREHLQVVRDSMPHLRRLEVRGWSGVDLLNEPFSFEDGPGRNRDTLEWLEVFLPMPTTISLLHANRHSLRNLRLLVSDEWPTASSHDHEDSQDEGLGDEEVEDYIEDGYVVVPVGVDCLRSRCWESLLKVYGKPEPGEVDMLASIDLLWPSSRPHDSWSCKRFARALGAVRPNLTVCCEVCRRFK